LGWPALHVELAHVDAATAARLEPADAQRIQRALEVFELTGQPLSVLQGRRESAGTLGDVLAVALLPADRARLHAIIAQRFDAMLAAGLVDEVRALRTRYPLHANMPSMRCVGYRQAWQHLDGAIDAPTMRAKGIAATRQLAKRQMTWLRSMSVPRVDPDAPGIVDAVTRLLVDGGIAES
jgi:tRNA dimethylallyltransferase